MLTSRKKQKVIKEFQTHEKDTGSSEIQTALLTKQITELVGHLKHHPKDHHSRRGLLKMVAKRKKLSDYLSKTNPKSYASVVKNLGLKK
ncbi:MAG: 30S ribosomal protein S15 [Candidatus Azambacteria bacterium]|nr:30S ribosomal protein S15 [Candidatus Azambacteria bacterium]